MFVSSSTLSSAATGASTVPAPRGEVHAAILRAAQATGVDFDYLLAQARLESGLDPAAHARTSSAAGLYQFTGSTWLRTLDRHGAAYGLDTASGATPRAQLLALRGDPQLSALMAGELANDNRATLTATLGRSPDNAELYLAHFLGADGAGRFLNALASDPGQSAAALLPKAADANRSIFFGAGGPRSVGAVMDLLRGRFDNALAGAPEAQVSATDWAAMAPSTWNAPSAPAFSGGPVAQEFHAAAAAADTLAARQGGAGSFSASMADTLRDTFALAGGPGGAAPDHVRAAYGRLRAFGL